MNEALLKPYTAEEIKEAMFDIGDYKAPGTDGLHAVFYKKFWAVVGEEVTKEVLQALNTGTIPEGWNETAIVLIPKVESPELITQFRPISLCNVVYKVISKVLSKRLKVILPEIISKTQSAFVPGRLITDNVLVAYECFHAIKKKRQGKRGMCAVKLDMDNRVATVMVASWYIWWSRRQIKNKEPVPNIVRTVLNIKGIVANNSKVKGSGNTIRRGGWTKPASGVYKLNVDAAYEPKTGSGATGAIIRDPRGNFIAACCDHTDHAIDVATMNALALFNGLKLAEQFAAQSLDVESDSMEVVEAVDTSPTYL
jgi:ribonuclease HI